MNASSAALAAFSGLGFGLSLIVAIGAQNAFVLRQGIRREHVLPVVAVCALSDVVMMTAGVTGFGTVMNKAPEIMTIAKYAGVAFLLGYAFLAAKRAFSATGLTAGGGAPIALGAAIATCLAVTWLNPHAYLDTVVLLGSFASTYAAPDRWFLTAGAITGSIIWFISLGFGARLLAPVFAKPRAWQVLDSVIALVMTSLAIGLVIS
ncbi:LysE/ArgO family amino acid transporter [Nocardia sp. SYP-A9097]|uniref:LysE/ArgO family amino acid transporter n=1 Tax=Nocardia sp. SYP-A9097 TaxID=2663237 RepID=UPI002814E474|nr:LysE/ArgO family amino acid transporter [Nocardia sp. SYP-A9097]